MTKSEKIWLAVGLLGIAALVMLETWRVHKSVAAMQAQFGTPNSTNATPPGQVSGPADMQDAIAAGIGPWYLYYNTPGTYMMQPPLVNTTIPPAGISNNSTATTNSPGCSTC